MAKMTKGTTSAKTAGPSKQYLKKGGKYQAGGVKLGPEAKAKTKPMKQMGGSAAKDTTGMTFPYVSPKGAIYSTGKEYMTGSPSSPTDPRNRDFMSKQDSTTQGRTGYTTMTKGEKKKGGMVKKQMGGVAAIGKLPRVKSGPKKMTPPSPRERKPNEIPYKKKGGMTKSKK